MARLGSCLIDHVLLVLAENSLQGMVSSIMKQQLGGNGSVSNNTEQVQILELLGAGGSAKVYRGAGPSHSRE
jgi:hypothetical protein